MRGRGNGRERSHAIGRELRDWAVLSGYLALFFSAFALFRNVGEEEAGVRAMRHGWALVEALVVGKFVLLGRAVGVGERPSRGPLVLAVLRQTGSYALLVLVLSVAEDVLAGAVRGTPPRAVLAAMLSRGASELLARTLVLVLALLPLLAFTELGKALGPGKLKQVFLGR